MGDILSKIDENKGWRRGATLQRFKVFYFHSINDSKNFLLQLIRLSTSKEVHLQVIPDRYELNIEVMLAYEPITEKEIQDLLCKIEEIYQELTICNND